MADWTTYDKMKLKTDFYLNLLDVLSRDVEAVKFLMLPLPAPIEVLCFRVRFRYLTLGIFCFRFRLRTELIASEFASAPVSFIKVLPLPQKFNRFRFHIPARYETANCIKLEKKAGKFTL